MVSVGSVSVDVVPSARGFRERVEALVRDLPSVKIVLDTSEAHAKIDELAARIASLGGEVRIRANTEEARLRLDELRAQLDELRDREVRVRVDNNFSELDSAAGAASVGAIGKIVLIGTALSALIPLAAAASIAIAGIGLGIGAGIAALLVGGLALGGVGSAVKAGSAPGQGAASAQQEAQAQQSITAAVNAHKQAVISLAVAERDAAQAEKDLTQARIDAANNIQNLTNAVADNQLAQRQAALDTANAALNLKVAKANPDAQNPLNANALAQVQLAYDQAKQKQLELAQAGDQAQQASTKANGLGVEGAQNVIDAHNKVSDTTNGVAQAQFNVADTAQKVALAQSAAAAQTSAFGTALAKLDPAQKAFAAFLLSLKPIFSTIKDAAANGFLPLLQKAIESLLPVMPQIAAIVGEIAKAFGDLAVKAAGFFTTPDGQKFLAFLQTSLGPTITTLGNIFGSLFKIAAGFFEQAYPLIKSFFDAISNGLGGAAGGVKGGALGGFFAYIKENLPQIKLTFEQVFGAVGSIITSLAPLAGPVLKVIGELAVDLAAIVKVAAPLVKLLIPFAPIIIGLVGAFKLLGPAISLVNYVMKIFDAEADANPIGLITIAIAALALGLIYAYQHSQTFRDIVNEIGRIFTEYVLPVLKEVGGFLIADFKFQLQVAIDIVKEFIALPSQIEKIWGAVTGFFTGLWKDVTGAFTSGVDAVKGFLVGAKNDIVGAWHDIWNGLSGIATAAFDGVVSAIKGTINGVIDVIDAAIKTINDKLIDTANQVPFVNIPHIPQIPHLAQGGPVVAGHPYIVGDGGKPELFVPAQNGVVHPDANAALNGTQTKSTGNTFNNYALDPNAYAYAIERRLRFARA